MEFRSWCGILIYSAWQAVATTADDILKYYLFYHSEKIRLDVSILSKETNIIIQFYTSSANLHGTLRVALKTFYILKSSKTRKTRKLCSNRKRTNHNCRRWHSKILKMSSVAIYYSARRFLDKFSTRQIENIFSYFSPKIGFDISCKVSS